MYKDNYIAYETPLGPSFELEGDKDESWEVGGKHQITILWKKNTYSKRNLDPLRWNPMKLVHQSKCE